MSDPYSIPLPPQPSGVPWPTKEWPRAEFGKDVDQARADEAAEALVGISAPAATGETRSLLAVHRGQLVGEHYPPEFYEKTPFVSWSCAKSILHAVVGILVGQGKLDPKAPAPVPEWASDARSAITLDALLRMSSGLEFVEDYVDTVGSDAIRMLFQEGRPDVAGYATAKPLAHEPDTVFSYSSGTSNIVARIAGNAIGGGEAGFRAFLDRELFGRLGMTTADPQFDRAGTFIGSSFVFATARDFARFGLLYLRDGMWEDGRVLPEGWVDYARTPTPTDPERSYGAHWWLAQDGSGIFNASGYQGQYIVVAPDRDVVLVRTGRSSPDQRGAVITALAEIVRAFPKLSS